MSKSFKYLKELFNYMEHKILDDIYTKLLDLEEQMVTKEELISYIDTIDILSNKSSMKKFNSSKEDIKTKKVSIINRQK